MRFVFSIPSRTSSTMVLRQRPGERPDPPKTSCSSYYSCNSHYTEAVADCIEFFNKSSQEGILDARKSDGVLNDIYGCRLIDDSGLGASACVASLIFNGQWLPPLATSWEFAQVWNAVSKVQLRQSFADDKVI
ncbi:hypothetical protein HHK36_002985 [Tetracentron sinense]|uniref:Uncharacterized protein n=1 Tax=Tetracentron sinense TaxID=13715 RepID=A0A834ZNF8_TETSI|nr:hypothetical protein HHK36_002985 [Tetracentron sinense]